MVAIVAIGIFALPSTMAMFGGQHNWYDINDDGNQVPCIKCHADVYDEYSISGVHGTLSGGSDESTTGPNPDDACDACHRASLTGYVYASGDGSLDSTPGQEAHAASTIACMECHEYGTAYPFAGGFKNMTGSDFNYDAFNGTGLNGTKAAHNDFIQGAVTDTLMEDSNEACITCHTHVAIDINWTHAYKMSLDAVQDANGDWVCDDFVTEGDYIIQTYGNMSGQTTGAEFIGVNISPTPYGYNESYP